MTGSVTISRNSVVTNCNQPCSYLSQPRRCWLHQCQYLLRLRVSIFTTVFVFCLKEAMSMFVPTMSIFVPTMLIFTATMCIFVATMHVFVEFIETVYIFVKPCTYLLRAWTYLLKHAHIYWTMHILIRALSIFSCEKATWPFVPTMLIFTQAKRIFVAALHIFVEPCTYLLQVCTYL